MQNFVIKEIEKNIIVRLLEEAEKFYGKAENVQAFKDRQKSKERK